MGAGLTLILGEARSGKSTHAEKLAAAYQRVAFVATAQAFDDDMAARIAAHRAPRPAHWTTIEAPRNVGSAIGQAGGQAHSQALSQTHSQTHGAGDAWQVVVVDCLTLLASNVLLAQPDPTDVAAVEAALRCEVDGLLAAYRDGDAAWIIVSNEVGLGIVPDNALGRVYRDLLGRANQQIAAEADTVLFMVAGLPMRVK